jgi:hypothetical protein
LKPKKKPEVTEDKYYTHEDIQNDKRSQFDKELNIKKNEFTSAVTLKIPPVPKFSDTKDEPIVEMEEALRKMAEQRKYDIDQIQLFTGPSVAPNGAFPKGQSHPSGGATGNLGSLVPNVDVEQKSIRGGTVPVYIKIDKENIVDNTIYKNEVIDLEPKRQITWSQTNDIIEQNIFSKLKPLKPETSYSFQQELDELKIKVELMNANINKILELLTR